MLLPAALPKNEKDPCPPDTAVPIVPDNCGLYGTFYVDLSGVGLRTFSSPTRSPKVPHPGAKTPDAARFSQPVFKSSTDTEGQRLPWKQALPAQPNMGVLKESWEKNYKRGEENYGLPTFVFRLVLTCNTLALKLNLI